MSAGAVGSRGREAFFLDAGSSRLFTLHYPAPEPGARARCVVVVPPFAEEMNRSRRMIHGLARRVQAAGFGLVAADLHGTGDSSGDFVDASWGGWRGDLAAVRDWTAEAGYAAVDWLAIRTGALLLLDDPPIATESRDRALLWHPVVSGAQYLAQFVRLRLAANMMGGRDKETSADLMAAFERGESVEIAGYRLPGALALALKAADLTRVPPPRLDVTWLDLVSRPDAKPSAPAAATCDRWRAAGVSVDYAAVQGPQFWAIQETTVAPALIDETLRRLVAAEPAA